MIEQIKQRVEKWKSFYTQNCEEIGKDSPWRDILLTLGYCSHDNFYPWLSESPGVQVLNEACRTIGTFSKEESEYLATLPAYRYVKLHLGLFEYTDHFHLPPDKIDQCSLLRQFPGTLEVFCMCHESKSDVPIREYIIVTDQANLWGLEIYIFNYRYRRPSNSCHAIIRYVQEAPADYVESVSEDYLPF